MKTPRMIFRSVALSALLSISSTSVFAATNYSVALLEGEGYPLSIASNALISGNDFGFGNPYFWSAAGNRLYSEPQPFTYGVAAAINKNGTALVDAQENGQGYFLWQDGKFSPVPTAVGAPVRINDAGQIATLLANGAVGLWSNGTLTDLGTLPGGSGTRVETISLNGHIVGSAVTAGGARRAVLWRDGTVTDLGTLPGDTASEAWNIDDAGNVVGFSYSATQSRPFRWSNGVMTALAPVGVFNPPGPLYLAGPGAVPYKMNSAGQVIGTIKTDTVNHAFVWDNGVFTDLNPILGGISTYGCNALNINESGQIVGSCVVRLQLLPTPFKLTPAAPGVNLTVTMGASPQPATQGSPLTYQLTVTNVGTSAARGVSLTDSLPAGASFVSAVASQGNCSGSAVITCALGDLAGGAGATAQIVVIPTIAGTLTNTATVSASEVDTDSSNNSATTSVTVNAPVTTADVAVTLTGSANTVKRTGKLTYSIKVNNGGPAGASAVVLKDTLPSAMKFVSASTSQGTCSGTTTVTCNLGSIVSGGGANVSIVVQANSRGTFTNTVSVTSTTTDTNTNNNSASVSTTVR